LGVIVVPLFTFVSTGTIDKILGVQSSLARNERIAKDETVSTMSNEYLRIGDDRLPPGTQRPSSDFALSLDVTI
jgi:hypothetical protein